MTLLAGESFLLCLAQIGLGFAGFSGLIISLRQVANPSWSIREVAALKFILGHCFGLVLLSLFPFVLAFMSWPQNSIWRVSNLTMSLFLAAEVILQAMRIRKGIRSKAPPVSIAALICCYVIPTAAISFVSAWKALSGSQPLFAFGLLWLLLQSGIQFSISLSGYTAPQTGPKSEQKQTDVRAS